MLLVRSAGPLATVQDRGRLGLAHLGVPRAGPLDHPAADLANRLVGNPEHAAVLEVTMGGLSLTSGEGLWLAVTGAPAPLTIGGEARGHARAEWLPADTPLELGVPPSGVRCYLAVAGGLEVEPVLGSRSTDTLAWVGPPRVVDGIELAVGAAAGPPAPLDTPAPAPSGPLRITPGPRADWFGGDALETLCAASYAVAGDSNRIGLRLSGAALEREREGELPSEGLVLGAVQVPPDGQPVVMLADHPPTGGYPVVGVVPREDVWRCAQLRPGDQVRFSVLFRGA